ncbi:hypothetical protein N9887_00010 [Flavobacteriaceae bacterium]|nr:hypothetical protein [Flavobacteriaceae bacterium]
MKNIIIFTLLFFSNQVFCQQQTKDSIFILYKGDTELIKMIKDKDNGVRSFSILLDKFRNIKFRDSIIERYRKRGGRPVPIFTSFQGIKNFIKKESLDKYTLNSIEDISKLIVNYYNPTKIFFIEKLGCNKYKFHETHLAYD